MSTFTKFENEKDENSGADPNGSKWGRNAFESEDGEFDDFRLEKLDQQFRKNPIQATLWTVFPHFNLISLTTGYVFLLIFFFIFEALMSTHTSWRCIIYRFGSNYIPAIQRWHIHRLVMPGFLHNEIFHLLWNIFALLSIGSNAEYFLGTIPYFILLGGSIILGNLFTAGFRSSVCSQSVGASVAVMGCIAFEIIWMYFNFKKMNRSKWLYALWFGTIIGTTILGAFVHGSIVDFWGHIGGFLAGVCVTGFFYHQLAKYSFMEFGKFVFPIVYGVLAFIAIINIMTRNTQKCYSSICQELFDMLY